MAAAATSWSYLPEEIWEHILKFLNDDGDSDYNHYNNNDENGMVGVNHHQGSFRFLSVVSKQFLYITNRLRFSVTISEKTTPFLQCLFERFPNVTSHNITLSSQDRNQEGDLNELLTQISNFPLDIKSLTLYHPRRVPEYGLRDLSKKMKNLTSVTCYKVKYAHKNDLFYIADCFPLLEELTFLADHDTHYWLLDGDDRFLAHPKLCKIALSYNISRSIKDLCKNCVLLEKIKVISSWSTTTIFGNWKSFPANW